MSKILEFLRKKYIFVPVAALASICILLLVWKSYVDDSKQKVIDDNLCIIKSQLKTLKPIVLNDSIEFKDSLIIQARNVQDEILFYRDYVSLLNLYVDSKLPKESNLYEDYTYRIKSLNYCNIQIEKIDSAYNRVIDLAVKEGIKCAIKSNTLQSIFQTNSFDRLSNQVNYLLFFLNKNITDNGKMNIIKNHLLSTAEQYSSLYDNIYQWSEGAFNQLNIIQEEKLIRYKK